MKLKNKLQELIFPPALYCIVCGNIIDDTRTYHICDHCIRKIEWQTRTPPIVEGMQLISCAEYELYARTIIFQLKYNRKKYIAREIGNMMSDRLMQAEIEADIIIPVPLSKRKKKERGFNQTSLIGTYLASLTGMQMEECVKRIRPTRPMRGLGPYERRENIQGCFSLNDGAESIIQGKRIIILDDFFTTGATGFEMKHTIEAANPKSIIFLSFATKVTRHNLPSTL